MMRWIILAALLLAPMAASAEMGPLAAVSGSSASSPLSPNVVTSGQYWTQPTMTGGASLIMTLGNAYTSSDTYNGIQSILTNNSPAMASSVTGTMVQGIAASGTGTAGGSFAYQGGAFDSGDGGALNVIVANYGTSINNTVRAMQIQFWGPQPATNGFVFINESSSAPYNENPNGGYAHNLIAINESFGIVADAAFWTDNGSANAPVNVGYGSWYDGSTDFTTAEYEGPEFRIGPTIPTSNAKVEVDGSATGNPTIKVVGYANTATGGTPATTGNLQLEGLGGGVVAALSPVGLIVSTVAALPACNTALANSMAAVSDATTPAYNAALTGGGAVHIPVFCNGTAWTAH